MLLLLLLLRVERCLILTYAIFVRVSSTNYPSSFHLIYLSIYQALDPVI